MKVKNYYYAKGIALPKLKGVTNSTETLELVEPNEVLVSVKQAKGILPAVVVKVGETVKRGTLLARSKQTSIFSPICGTVEAIELHPSIYGNVCKHIKIKNSYAGEVDNFEPLVGEAVTPVSVLKRIYEAGIVDGDGVPLFIKFILKDNQSVNELVINACTDEAGENNNLALLNLKLDKLLAGAKYLAGILDIKKITFVFADSLKKPIKKLFARLSKAENKPELNYALMSGKYPAGDNIEILGTMLGEVLPKKADSKYYGKIIVDIYTLLAVAEAVEDGEKGYKKLLSVVLPEGGKIKNIWACIGDTVGNIYAQATKSDQASVAQIIVGGIMRGIAVSDYSMPITKCLKGIMFLPDKSVCLAKEKDCIKCGRCNNVCPRGIYPREIDASVLVSDFVLAKEYGVNECTRCGCCTYVCPAKRNMVERFIEAQKVLEGRK